MAEFNRNRQIDRLGATFHELQALVEIIHLGRKGRHAYYQVNKPALVSFETLAGRRPPSWTPMVLAAPALDTWALLRRRATTTGWNASNPSQLRNAPGHRRTRLLGQPWPGAGTKRPRQEGWPSQRGSMARAGLGGANRGCKRTRWTSGRSRPRPWLRRTIMQIDAGGRSALPRTIPRGARQYAAGSVSARSPPAMAATGTGTVRSRGRPEEEQVEDADRHVRLPSALNPKQVAPLLCPARSARCNQLRNSGRR